jgi:nicotinate-nucleotide adenylyltransferase
LSQITNIGLFGGTFDPPHLAHLDLTRMVAEKLNLKCVYFIPSANHPLKENTKITPVEIRCEMLAAALENYPQFKLSKIEVDRPTVSYTIDTIKNFTTYEDLKNVKLYLIVGSDNISEIHLWKDPDKIFQLVNVVVLIRPGTEKSKLMDQYSNNIILLDLPLMPLSSTELRQKIKNSEEFIHLLPIGVAEIIEKYNLYR